MRACRVWRQARRWPPPPGQSAICRRQLALCVRPVSRPARSHFAQARWRSWGPLCSAVQCNETAQRGKAFSRCPSRSTATHGGRSDAGGSRTEIASKTQSVALAIAAPQCCGSVRGVKPRAPSPEAWASGSAQTRSACRGETLAHALSGPPWRAPAGMGAPVFPRACQGVQPWQMNGPPFRRGK